MTTGSVSRLTFNPLAASDAGSYTCRASVGGVMKEQEFTVLVNGMLFNSRKSSTIICELFSFISR